MHFDAYNWIRDIKWWKEQFEEVVFVWTAREANSVADLLARRPLPEDMTLCIHNYVPVFITSAKHKDYVSSSYHS